MDPSIHLYLRLQVLTDQYDPLMIIGKVHIIAFSGIGNSWLRSGIAGA